MVKRNTKKTAANGFSPRTNRYLRADKRKKQTQMDDYHAKLSKS